MISRTPHNYPYKYPHKSPDKLPDKLPDKFETDNLYVKKLISVMGDRQLSIRELLAEMGLKDRENFMDIYLSPSITHGFVRLLYPDRPNHPRQRYLLTEKGQMLLERQ